MNKITEIFSLEKWRVKRITLIVAALVLAGCQSQAVQSTAISTPTEISAIVTLLPVPNDSVPTDRVIVDIESESADRFAELSAAFRASNSRSGMIPVGGFVVSGEMGGEQISEEFVVLGRDMENLALARVTNDKDGDLFTMLEFGDATLENGSVVPVFGIKSENGTIQPILSIDSSKGTGILFRNSRNCGFSVGDGSGSGAKNAMVVNNEYLPLLSGSSEFVKKYKPELRWGLRQVVDKENNAVITQIWDRSSGNELALWDGEKWADGWQAKVPKESLEEGSEMWKKVKLSGISSHSTISPEFNLSELNGQVIGISKEAYLEKAERFRATMGDISFEGIVVFMIEQNSDGTLTRVPYLGAVHVRDGVIGLGIPSITGAEYNRTLRQEDYKPKVPTSLNEMLQYYQSQEGKTCRVAYSVPELEKGTKPLDPNIFAMSVFPNYGSEFNVVPGEALFEPDNAWFRFARAMCSQQALPCYAAQVIENQLHYKKSSAMADLVKDSPVPVVMRDFEEGTFR